MSPKSINKHKSMARMYCKAYLRERCNRIDTENKFNVISRAYLEEQDRRMKCECQYETLKNENRILAAKLAAKDIPWYKKLLK